MRERKKILVTGGSGFLGRAVCRRLVQDGYIVRASVRRNVDVANGVSTVHGELSPTFDWTEALDGIDIVVHTAALVHQSSRSSYTPSDSFRDANVYATLNLARQAAIAGVQRFIFVSTIGVNGAETTARPFTAAGLPNPHSPYATSKYEAEQGLRQLGVEFALEIVVLRPPLVYGPGAPGNFGTLVRALKSGWPLPLGMVTSNRRSLVALDNLVDLIVLCMDHPLATSQPLLVSDGEDLSTADLLCRLGRGIGKPVRLLPVPVGLLRFLAWALGVKHVFQSLCGSLQVDNSQTRQLLSWSPPLKIDEGLKRVWERE